MKEKERTVVEMKFGKRVHRERTPKNPESITPFRWHRDLKLRVVETIDHRFVDQQLHDLWNTDLMI